MERHPDHDIDKIFIKRWSPRAMDGDISDEELMRMFEAARWAPSSYNNQHWRFIYAKKGSARWNDFLGLLMDANRAWAKNASALLIIVSKKTFDHNGTPALTHSFDTGAAWENLALQAAAMGLVTHGMQGFDYEKARKIAKVPDDYNVEAMTAIGRPGNPKDLPEELQKHEKPGGRKPLSDIVFEGEFRGK